MIKMSPARLEEILTRGQHLRLLVIGDLMLDEFVWGKVGRISPEAPVPVVEVVRESAYPGGAANVARNVREFCHMVSVIGLVGRDMQGDRLRSLLAEEKIETEGCLLLEDFSTIVKTRIIARQQQVVRVDREEIRPLNEDQTARVADTVAKLLPNFDAIIFEDYGKGFLSEPLVSKITGAAKGKVVAADPNPHNPIAWRGLSVVKPNRAEAFQAAGLRDDGTRAAVEKVGATLLQKWATDLLLVTLGDEGMMLFQRDAAPHQVPAKARQVFDVSGAGDTAIGLFTLALAAGATPPEAAEIANHASAVVVGKLGTATVSAAELRESFANE